MVLTENDEKRIKALIDEVTTPRFDMVTRTANKRISELERELSELKK